jgi:phosphomannomutase
MMPQKSIVIADMMQESQVKFGTSGARGLVEDMSDEVCYAYTKAFLQHLENTHDLSRGTRVGVGGDLRPSTPRIVRAVAKAIDDGGYLALGLGALPSPALAYFGISNQIPTVMITGSHIPADRNGIKYTKKAGEILKSDEAAIKAQEVDLPWELFDQHGNFVNQPVDLQASPEAIRLYVKRYYDFFAPGCLKGLKVGVFQHSAVGRDLLVAVFEGLGAEVVPLGFSECFVAVDTEAIRPEDVEAANLWSKEHGLDAIVSTDGDSDRPLVADETGKWLRGDVAGILTAATLKADAVVTPVSCNSAVEKSGLFKRVYRTKIGSPYVIEAMQQAVAEGFDRVVGYEANGGFLIQSDLQLEGRHLPALPTRDAMVLLVAMVLSAKQKGLSISQLVAGLPPRYTISDRLKRFDLGQSHARLLELHSGDPSRDKRAIEDVFGGHFGHVKNLDATDGLRITFENEEVVHLRPSGNAPEFRCYTEAASEDRAKQTNAICLQIMESWRQ